MSFWDMQTPLRWYWLTLHAGVLKRKKGMPHVRRSPRCRRRCTTCTLYTATGTSSPPASCCRWTADTWGDLQSRRDAVKEGWRDGWKSGQYYIQKFPQLFQQHNYIILMALNDAIQDCWWLPLCWNQVEFPKGKIRKCHKTSVNTVLRFQL